MLNHLTPPIGVTAELTPQLVGTWSVYLIICQIGQFPTHPDVEVKRSCDLGLVGTVSYQLRDDGSITGEYLFTECLVGSDQPPDKWRWSLQSGPSQESINAIFCDDERAPTTPGVRSQSSLRFVSDYHEGCVFWRPFVASGEKHSVKPSKLSVIVRNVTNSSWLLDVCF